MCRMWYTILFELKTNLWAIIVNLFLFFGLVFKKLTHSLHFNYMIILEGSTIFHDIVCTYHLGQNHYLTNH